MEKIIEEKKAEKLGVIDLGANTMRLVIWEITDEGVVNLLDELRETVRMAEDIDILGIVSEPKIIEILSVLRRFQVLMNAMEVTETIAVASDTLRRAENSDEVVSRIKADVGIDVRILLGIEEAFLDYEGIVNSMKVKNSLVVDIGGASTELLWIKNGEMKESTSIPVGTLNLTRKYGLNDVVSPKNHIDLEDYLAGVISKVPWIGANFFNDIIAVGGSARTIAKVDMKKKRYPLSIIHNYTLYDSDVTSLYVTCMAKNQKQRQMIEGLSKDRSDIILGALAIMTSILKTTGIQNVRISGKGIREGVLYDYVRTKHLLYSEMLDRSILNVMKKHDVDQSHAEAVYYLTEKIFSGLTPLHKLGKEYDDILKTSCMLHDVGMSIRYYDHEKHSFYIIINSEINGMSHKDVLLSAFAAGYHRNFSYEISNINFGQILNRLDISSVEKLGVCISIAECLDRSLSGLVYDLSVEIEEDTVRIIPYSEFDLTLEIFEAMRVAERFRGIFKKDLCIVHRNSPCSQE